MYQVYLDGVLFPVGPAKIETKPKNQNKTIKLLSGKEINIPKQAGLTTYSMDLLIPNSLYPFAEYKGGFKDSKFYLEHLQKLKNSKEPFELTILRDGLRNTQDLVVLEESSVVEDAKEGADVVVKLNLKKYVSYGVKPFEPVQQGVVKRSVAARETKTSPAPKDVPKKHTVVSGDTLWALAKFYYGNGSLYPKIASVNGISNPNLIKVGQELIIPVV